MNSYDYKTFLNDSSDDYPKYDSLEWGSFKKIPPNPEFKEVIRLARAAIQPWWTEEYKKSTESAILEVEKYLEENIIKTD